MQEVSAARHPTHFDISPSRLAGAQAATVDEDVVAAVHHELKLRCDELIAFAHTLDPVFATDIAERLAAYTLGGGSRIRPRFLWWALRSCGGSDVETPAALRIAAALELIQSCALIHDDVMDHSAVRRGRPSFHAQLALQYSGRGREVAAESFAHSAAVLAGDLALSWADDLVATADLEPRTRTKILHVWRAMRAEMVAGQYLDVHGQATSSRSAVQAIRTVCLKTARYTVERPLALGAVLAGADESTSRALGAAGRCAGIAFQLRDDLLGVFGDPAVTGKPSGDDIRSGKATYLIALAHTRAQATKHTSVTDLLDSCRGDAALSEQTLAAVREALVSTGAPERVERRIARLSRAAEHHLCAAHLSGPAADHLTALLRQIAAPRHQYTAGAADPGSLG
ncbi:polyprenyl synthetase family protein [Streptomyces sp. NPDC001568]|uniref:polyprenyl synthetase family protein n=1 Tax=Streptomyces sp. NPDC001568 TaxID=3364588 RepID=UPI0036CA833B